MTKYDILAAFETEINKIDDVLNKPVTSDSFYWLQQAATKFTKTRFNGSAPKFTSFEQNEKRYKDLAGLVKMSQIVLSTNIPNNWPVSEDKFKGEILNNEGTINYYGLMPADVMYVLTENATITDLEDEHPYSTGVFECTTDTYSYRITNSLTDFHYKHHRARPLRIRLTTSPTSNEGSRCVELVTDGNYKISKYVITYLSYPNLDDITGWNDEIPFFTNDTWPEIIKIAAQMYVENQSEPRYRTLTDQVLSQE